MFTLASFDCRFFITRHNEGNFAIHMLVVGIWENNCNCAKTEVEEITLQKQAIKRSCKVEAVLGKQLNFFYRQLYTGELN